MVKKQRYDGMDERLIHDIKTAYGLDVSDVRPVDGGWLNRKWRIKSGGSELLVKQFSRERYDDRKLAQINTALLWQTELYSMGVPCPKIVMPRDGSPIRFDGELCYMVMEFAGGCIGDRLTVNEDQLYSLGSACALMKRGYARLSGSVDIAAVKGYPLGSDEIITSLQKYRDKLTCVSNGISDARFVSAVRQISRIVDSLDISWLNSLERGLAHEDFSPDNMLFYPDKLSAILDFDRSQYSLVLHDIGRILTSLALDTENGFDLSRVRAFMHGYGDITMHDIADAVRCVWLIEAPWWINGREYFYATPKVRRFCEELLWISEHYFELDDIFVRK